ncbi:sensor histidine kinase [Velocimicrobium porci]|uniref:HAMP domain-containing protein n=1 Tax=Velocimicrobium porci TaxID=2606634 RepID=A0A6L5XXD7_9FIRM|nr:histidine kinase [Velocimicrobium porci]MSS63415.1 hypothetical protein [Velocimicrobium porci]
MRKKNFGIQKKLFMYMMILITLMLIILTVGIGGIVSTNVRKNLLEQYRYVNDKFYTGFENLYEALNTATESCITNESVQQSLKNKKLTVYEKETLTSALRYMGNSYTDYCFYVDNKENIYSLHNLDINFKDFYNSYLYKGMGNDYSKLKLFWERDFVSGSMDMALFAGRLIHQMDKSYQPGIFYIKLQQSALETMVKEMEKTDAIFFLVDQRGQICYEKEFKKIQKEEELGSIRKEIERTSERQNRTNKKEYTSYSSYGVVIGEKQNETGFTAITFVPNRVINHVLSEILCLILAVFCSVFLLTFVLSKYFTEKFTKPIRYISELMENFDDLEFTQKAALNTNTELDYIGNSYNKMLEKIRILAGEVRFKERELRKAELDTLLYQIHPHFLYNTLDTVYMLARISKEQTIMKMIQSLSKYFRIILSNGAEEITIEEELEHVKAYLDIQKIRNNELFFYEIECEDSIRKNKVIKMILQPLAENCIKHGFLDMEEKGRIVINVKEMGEDIVFSIQNNGMLMSEKIKNRLNRLESTDMEAIHAIMTKEKGGYGISNVVKRLRLTYQEQIRFYYVVSAQYTTCVIKIKKVMMENDENSE